jgi:putative permease
MFGFWGVFFAIPLATLVQAIIKAWFARNSSLASADEDTETAPAG